MCLTRFHRTCRASVGALVLVDTSVVLDENDLEIVGELDCSDDGNCPGKGTFYDSANDEMCPAGSIDGDGRVCSASVRVCVCVCVCVF